MITPLGFAGVCLWAIAEGERLQSECRDTWSLCNQANSQGSPPTTRAWRNITTLVGDPGNPYGYGGFDVIVFGDVPLVFVYAGAYCFGRTTSANALMVA
jgi:hypothetical protein